MNSTQTAVISLLGFHVPDIDKCYGFKIDWKEADKQSYFKDCITIGDFYKAYLRYKMQEAEMTAIILEIWKTIDTHTIFHAALGADTISGGYHSVLERAKKSHPEITHIKIDDKVIAWNARFI